MSSKRTHLRTWLGAAIAAVVLGVPMAASAGTLNSLSSVDSSEHDGATTVLIRGSRTPTFTVYKLDNPSRVVVDLSNAELGSKLARSGDGKVTWTTNTWAVSSVTGYQRSGAGNRVRVVVSLARAATYKVQALGNSVQVRVTPKDKPVVSNDQRELEAARREIAAQKRETQREADRLRKARALAEAEAAQAQRDRAEAAKLVKAAESMRSAASAEVAQARADVERAKEESKRARQSAKERRQQAEARLAEAESMMKAARNRMASANRAKSEANKATRDAKQREDAANEARSRAERAKREAEEAQAKALASKKAASKARARGESAVELERQAARLQAKARSRQAAAASAQRKADAARNAAEAAATAAEAQRRRADAERAAAEKQRRLAEARRLEAEKAAKLADKRRETAEAQAAAAERRVTELRTTLAAVKKQVERAKSVRSQEEASMARAQAARRAAESRQQAAALAAAKVEASLRATRKAASKAQAMSHAAKTAAAELDQSENRGASRDELQRMRKRSEQLAASYKRAKAELAAQKRELEDRRRQAAVERTARDQALAEVAQLRSSTEKASKRRRQQKRELAELAARRQEAEIAYRKIEAASAKAEAERLEAEKELARARQETATLERKLASAEGRFARIENEAATTLSKTERELARARKEAESIAQEHRRLVAETRAAQAKLERAKRDLSTSSKARVHGVDFEQRNGASRVVVGLSSPAKPRVVRNRGKRAELVIPDVSMARKLERTIDASRHRGPVRSVSAYRDPKNPSDVRVVVELNQPTQGVLKRVGTTYYWDFGSSQSSNTQAKLRSTSQPSPVLAAAGRRSRRRQASSAPITQATVARMGSKRKVYRGRPIDLDFKDADIHNLLRLLADVGGVNIVIPDEIKASITVRLRRVPWDQAMEVILASKGLWYRRQGDLIRIAPRKELDAEDKAEAERIKSLRNSEAPEPEIFTLNYATGAQIRPQLQPLLSPKGRIEVDARTNSLIINDVRAHRRRIIEMIRRLDTQTPQIQIEARIVEARSTFVREFGIQWGGNFQASQATGNATGLIFPSSFGVAGAAEDGQTPTSGVASLPSDFAVNLPAAIGTGSGGGLGFSFGSVGGNFNLNLRLSALEDNGTVRIVSQPKITTINNVQATISQGVSIPISVVSANGAQTQFVPADLSLSVTPHVSQRDCSVSMQVNVTNNQPDFANTGSRGDPSILRREARTTVIVKDGETTVIGGIYTRNSGRSYSKVPFLAELPVIGLLFKNRRDVDERAEVLVFLTPKITNRAYLKCE